MELKNKDGMYIVSEKDYTLIKDIKSRWQELHGKYFKVGKCIAEISELFNKIGK